MSDQIIDMHVWFQTPAGQYLLEWERTQVDEAVADIFGYHALQLGVPELEGLRANRMPHQWLAAESWPPDASSALRVNVVSDFTALPFPASSLDLVVLPHTLEFSKNPHASLREVERVLVPEGRVVICGLNPTSLWGCAKSAPPCTVGLAWDSFFCPMGATSLAIGACVIGYTFWVLKLRWENSVVTVRVSTVRVGWSVRHGWIVPVLGGGPFLARRIFGCCQAGSWHAIARTCLEVNACAGGSSGAIGKPNPVESIKWGSTIECSGDIHGTVPVKVTLAPVDGAPCCVRLTVPKKSCTVASWKPPITGWK